MYIRQTGRSFRERLREHFRSYFNQDDASNYANHLMEANHRFNDNYKVLHQEQKGAKLNALEALETNKLRNDNVLLNDQLDLNSSPLLNLNVNFN